MHVSLLRSVPKGEDVELRAEVIRRSTNLAFIRCDAWRLSNVGEELVATATVTKSLTMGKTETATLSSARP
jgi:acyl-coenzyme A thioesterase PaaI-like protein